MVRLAILQETDQETCISNTKTKLHRSFCLKRVCDGNINVKKNQGNTFTYSIERPYGVYPWFDFALVVKVDYFQEGRFYSVGFSHGSDLQYKTYCEVEVELVVT